jgi:hypothetical protein
MLAPIQVKRALLAAAVFAGAMTSVAQPNLANLAEPMTIYGQFQDRTVMVTAPSYSPARSKSLQWKGVEFIDDRPGRHLHGAQLRWVTE